MRSHATVTFQPYMLATGQKAANPPCCVHRNVRAAEPPGNDVTGRNRGKCPTIVEWPHKAMIIKCVQIISELEYTEKLVNAVSTKCCR